MGGRAGVHSVRHLLPFEQRGFEAPVVATACGPSARVRGSRGSSLRFPAASMRGAGFSMESAWTHLRLVGRPMGELGNGPAPSMEHPAPPGSVHASSTEDPATSMEHPAPSGFDPTASWAAPKTRAAGGKTRNLSVERLEGPVERRGSQWVIQTTDSHRGSEPCRERLDSSQG